MGSILCVRNTVQDTYTPATYAGNYATILIQPLTNCVNDTALIRYARPDGGVEAVFGFVQTQYGAGTTDFVIQGSSCGYSEKLRIAGNFVGIGTCTPCSTLDVYRIGSGAAGTGDNLILRGGNSNNLFGSNQIRFGYSGGIGYSHAIKSRHSSATNTQNALDFFIWTTADAAETTGTKLVMTLDGTGNVGMGTCSPCRDLHVVNGGGGIMRIGPYYTSGADRDYLEMIADGYYSRIITNNECMGIQNCGGPLLLQPNSGSGNVGIGTTSAPMALTFTDSLGGKILFNNNPNNYSIGLASGVVSADSSMKFMAGCTTPGDFTFYRGSTLSMIIACTGNVGIGTSAPANAIHVCRAAGSAALALQIGGLYNYFFGNGCCMGMASDSGTTGVKLQVSRQSPDDSLVINSSGNVGINCASPSYKLHVNGTFYAAGSSQDYKQSICNYNTDSCMFMKLKPVTYQYKEEYCHLGKELKSGTQIGLIAEEVAESHPELAILVNEEDNKVVRNVDYEKLTIILLSELQKLRQEVDQLKNK